MTSPFSLSTFGIRAGLPSTSLASIIRPEYLTLLRSIFSGSVGFAGTGGIGGTGGVAGFGGSGTSLLVSGGATGVFISSLEISFFTGFGSGIVMVMEGTAFTSESMTSRNAPVIGISTVTSTLPSSRYLLSVTKEPFMIPPTFVTMTSLLVIRLPTVETASTLTSPTVSRRFLLASLIAALSAISLAWDGLTAPDWGTPAPFAVTMPLLQFILPLGKSSTTSLAKILPTKMAMNEMQSKETFLFIRTSTFMIYRRDAETQRESKSFYPKITHIQNLFNLRDLHN